MISSENKKILAACLFFIALALIGVAAYDLATVNNVFEVVVNNTDLGINNTAIKEHDSTGERLPNVTYFANDTSLQVMLFFHVIGSGQAMTVDANISINDTMVLEKRYITTAGTGIHEHFSFFFIVPKGASYKLMNTSTVTAIEWREYPILSGKNGTLSIVQNSTNITNINGGNASYPINLSNTSQVTFTPENLSNKSDNINLGTSTALYPTQNATKTYVDTSDNLKLSKSGDTSTGIQTFNAGINTTGINNFSVTRFKANNSQTIANDNNTKMILNTTTINKLGEGVTGTGATQSRFVALYPGNYEILAEVDWNPLSTPGATASIIYINGIFYNECENNVGNTNEGSGCTKADTVFLNPGDFVELFGWHRSSTPQTLTSTIGTTLSVVRVS